jgi:C-terminal processing protease CtpA/Prc
MKHPTLLPLLLAALLPCVRAQEPASPAAPAPAATAASAAPEAIAAAIQALGSDSFRAREAAQAKLVELGMADHGSVLDACLRAAVTNQDVEVQLRLEDVLAQVVDRKIYDTPKGFLGIRLMKETILYKGKAIPAILASEVLPNTGAAKAGVLTGDYIIRCDGKIIPEDPTTLAFIQYIQSNPPGYKVKLDVLRGEKEMKFEVVLGGRPAEARGYPFRPEKSFEEFYSEWRTKEHERLGLPAPKE